MYENIKYDKSNSRKRKHTFRIENPCIEDNRGKSVRNRACHFHDIPSKVEEGVWTSNVKHQLTNVKPQTFTIVGTLTSNFNFVEKIQFKGYFIYYLLWTTLSIWNQT
jgi:hypothetical protein